MMSGRLISAAAVVSAVSMMFAVTGCALKPSPPPTPTELTISATELTLKSGESKTLTANADDVMWLSGNDNIAKVNDGVVTAVAVGKTTIYAISGDNEASCAVTVTYDYGTDDPDLIKDGYKLIWHDEFDGDALNMDNWSYQTGTRDNYGGNQGPAD